MADEPSTPLPHVAPAGASSAAAKGSAEVVVVKKYANRRLYNTETSSYITLDNLAEMIRAGRDFVVFDAKSGDDITRGVLTQIIVEEESKGSAMLPTAFLRQLIGFYGGSLEGVVPRYLEYSMSSFARQQQQVRTVMERTFSPFLPSGVEEMNRHNMALFERAVSMWNPFGAMSQGMGAANGGAPGANSQEAGAQGADFAEAGSAEAGSAEAEPDVTAEAAPASDVPAAEDPEIAWMRGEIDSLRRQLAVAHAAAVVPPPKVAIPENVRRDPVSTGSGSRPMRRAGRKAGDGPG